MKEKKIIYSREEMFKMNKKKLEERGVTLEDIALIAYKQQSKYNPNIQLSTCLESVAKILTYRDIFHIVQLGIELDILTEQGKLSEPMQGILEEDLGMFGIDEILGLSIASNYGVIGQTNFGDIDVNKPGIVGKLNKEGKGGKCHTFLDDIVGALAAAASTRVAQIQSEEYAEHDPNIVQLQMNLKEKK